MEYIQDSIDFFNEIKNTKVIDTETDFFKDEAFELYHKLDFHTIEMPIDVKVKIYVNAYKFAEERINKIRNSHLKKEMLILDAWNSYNGENPEEEQNRRNFRAYLNRAELKLIENKDLFNLKVLIEINSHLLSDAIDKQVIKQMKPYWKAVLRKMQNELINKIDLLSQANKQELEQNDIVQGVKTLLRAQRSYVLQFPEKKKYWEEIFEEIFCEDYTIFSIGEKVDFSILELDKEYLENLGFKSNDDWKEKMFKEFGTFIFKIVDMKTNLNSNYNATPREENYNHFHLTFIKLEIVI